MNQQDMRAADAKALATAQEIALMWGNDRSQFVSRIQLAVLDAMRWAAGEPKPAKCDGNHGGPRCADPECWNDSPVSPTRYRKKPVEIEAHQWHKNGDHPLDYSRTHDGLENGELRQFSPEERSANDWEGDIVRYYRRPGDSGDRSCQHCGKTMHEHGWIETMEGGHIVCPGDWIITGIQGEHYPCKPDIFAATYEPAGSQTNIPEIPDSCEQAQQSADKMNTDAAYISVRVGEHAALHVISMVQLDCLQDEQRWLGAVLLRLIDLCRKAKEK